MHRRHQHGALPDARPDEVGRVADLGRELRIVQCKVAELEVFVEAQRLRRLAEPLEAELIGELAEGQVAAARERRLEVDRAVGGSARADDAAALVRPFAGADERLAEHVRVCLL